MLSTACPPLDALLDGGLEEDAITLVFGEGGSGKTNLALQCAREVVARGAKVAYIDTEGVSGRRMDQVFAAAFTDPDERALAEERVLFFSPFTIMEQEKMVERTSLLKGLGLVVVDSINMHYRLHIEDESREKEASRSLYKQLHHLTGFARQQQVPVLVTGQVYGGEDTTQPFARRVMEHLVKALVRFEKRPDGTRRATVLKHRSIEDGRQARFRIGPHGLVSADSAPSEARGRPARDAQAPAGPLRAQPADDPADPGGAPEPGPTAGPAGPGDQWAAETAGAAMDPRPPAGQAGGALDPGMTSPEAPESRDPTPTEETGRGPSVPSR